MYKCHLLDNIVENFNISLIVTRSNLLNNKNNVFYSLDFKYRPFNNLNY